MNQNANYSLGIDIGSTTVKIAILDQDNNLVFSDYERHYANIQETLALLLDKARKQLGSIELSPMITGSGGLALSEHLKVPFVQEVVAVSTALEDYAPQTDVAIELGGEDAKIIYFTNGIEQRMVSVPVVQVLLLSRWLHFYRQTLQVLMNMQKIIRKYILLQPVVVYLRKQIYSHLLTKVPQKKIWQLQFFRLL